MWHSSQSPDESETAPRTIEECALCGCTGIPKEELFSQTVKEMTPLGRPVDPVDIANMVLFLSSDVSRNITGETLNVNGGSYMD